MARTRTMKPDAQRHLKLRACSIEVRHFWTVLVMTQADDEGRFELLHAAIIADGYPSDRDVTADVINGWMADLVAVRLVQLYEVGGITYGYLHDWLDWQTISHAKPSKFPPPPPENHSGWIPEWFPNGSGSSKGPGAPVDIDARKLSGIAPESFRANLTRTDEKKEGRREPAQLSPSATFPFLVDVDAVAQHVAGKFPALWAREREQVGDAIAGRPSNVIAGVVAWLCDQAPAWGDDTIVKHAVSTAKWKAKEAAERQPGQTMTDAQKAEGLRRMAEWEAQQEAAATR